MLKQRTWMRFVHNVMRNFFFLINLLAAFLLIKMSIIGMFSLIQVNNVMSHSGPIDLIKSVPFTPEPLMHTYCIPAGQNSHSWKENRDLRPSRQC